MPYVDLRVFGCLGNCYGRNDMLAFQLEVIVIQLGD